MDTRDEIRKEILEVRVAMTASALAYLQGRSKSGTPPTSKETKK